MNYYVYYKLPPDRAAALRPAVEAMFQEIEKRCGVRGRWMRRRDDSSTYMEVYEGVQNEGPFEALLAREGEKLGVPRKLERFVCV